jgi:hypothetical protein
LKLMWDLLSVSLEHDAAESEVGADTQAWGA